MQAEGAFSVIRKSSVHIGRVDVTEPSCFVGGVDQPLNYSVSDFIQILLLLHEGLLQGGDAVVMIFFWHSEVLADCDVSSL